MSKMIKHYVTFVSPGTFFDEQTTKEIDAWDIEKAQKMAEKIEERYDSKPFAFYFTTQERKDEDWEKTKETKSSPVYYMNAKIETYEEIKARHLKDDKMLLENMEINDFDKIVTNGPGSKTWKFARPYREGKDVLL